LNKSRLSKYMLFFNIIIKFLHLWLIRTMFLNLFNLLSQKGVVVHACNPSTWEAEADGFHVWSQPETYNKTLSQNKTKQQFKNSIISFDAHKNLLLAPVRAVRAVIGSINGLHICYVHLGDTVNSSHNACYEVGTQKYVSCCSIGGLRIIVVSVSVQVMKSWVWYLFYLKIRWFSYAQYKIIIQYVLCFLKVYIPI
jgi:hypothetical protein